MKVIVSFNDYYRGEYETDSKIVEFDDVIDDSLAFNMGVLSFHIMKGEKPEGIFFRTRYITSWHVIDELLESEDKK